MGRFVYFLKKIYVLLIFVLLEIVALRFYAHSTEYTQARMLTAASRVTGSVYGFFAETGRYFSLRAENRLLVDELARLNSQLQYYRQLPDSIDIACSDHYRARYEYMQASVINNSITRSENFITLDRGRGDGVVPNMAVITPDGRMVGYVLNCSDRFSVAISVLNTGFRTGGKIAGKGYFGSIHWNGVDHRKVTLSEIPKYADVAVGDTILTDYSSIFPPDIVIGTVSGFELTQSGYYDLEVDVAADMSRLKKVLVVNYIDAVEREETEYQARMSAPGRR